MRITAAIAAGVVLLLSGLTAQALESSAKTASKLSADAVWSKIGDFCGISNWHPAVEKCELSADGKTRTLSLKGGGTIVEALVKMDAAGHSYTYSIVSSPLPVADTSAGVIPGSSCCTSLNSNSMPGLGSPSRKWFKYSCANEPLSVLSRSV